MSGGGSAGGYVIERSLRFMAASSQYLTRTPSVAGNRRLWTYSYYGKLGQLGTFRGLLATPNMSFGFYNDNRFFLTIAGVGVQVTSALFRDTSAWYHVLVTLDTAQATAANRFKVSINGTDCPFTSSIVAQNTDYEINSTAVHQIGTTSVSGGTTYNDGYGAEINFVNAQALTPSSFGEINQTTDQSVAKKYTGTYGTNGFYLDFKDGTSTTTLGYDKSGNNNHWTLTNFTRSAGVNDCWMKDVPAGNGSASAVQPSGNYAVLNPLRQNGSGAFLNGNLSGTSESGTSRGLCATVVLSRSDKWYCEVTPVSSATNWFGVTANEILAADVNTSGQQSVMYYGNGTKWVNGTNSAYGSSYTTETIGMLFDGPANTITFYRSNVSQGAITLPSSSVDYVFFMGNAGGGGVTNAINFGQRSFAYSPPAGAKALCTANLTSTDVIESGSFTGNASADGPFIWCNGTPETLTINGNAVTWGTHADRLSNGFKLRTSSSSYNSSGTNTWTATILSPESKSAFKHQNAKGN